LLTADLPQEVEIHLDGKEEQFFARILGYVREQLILTDFDEMSQTEVFCHFEEPTPERMRSVRRCHYKIC
jgi:hypothetical protein